jgi:hypothetical protein
MKNLLVVVATIVIAGCSLPQKNLPVVRNFPLPVKPIDQTSDLSNWKISVDTFFGWLEVPHDKFQAFPFYSTGNYADNLLFEGPNTYTNTRYGYSIELPHRGKFWKNSSDSAEPGSGTGTNLSNGLFVNPTKEEPGGFWLYNINLYASSGTGSCAMPDDTELQFYFENKKDDIKTWQGHIDPATYESMDYTQLSSTCRPVYSGKVSAMCTTHAGRQLLVCVDFGQDENMLLAETIFRSVRWLKP